MRALAVSRLDGPDGLSLVHVDEPAAAVGDVLIDVHAAGVAWPDLLMTRGQYQNRPELPFVPGGEVAGIVRHAPPGGGLRTGQRVMALTSVGGWQDVVCVSRDRVFALPDRISLLDGAGLPFNLLTVHFALTRRTRVEPGETVLVHGAGGGIGLMALSLARVLGARTLAVVSSEPKARAALAAGADRVLRAEAFADEVRSETVNVIVDPVGGRRVTDSLRALAPEGRLLVLGFTSGEIPEIRLNRLLLRNVSVVGVGWGSFARHERSYAAQQWAELSPLLDRGELVPPRVVGYPAEQAANALRLMEARELVGKAVLSFRGTR